MTRKGILMICSWFDHRTMEGVFFKEQAMLLTAEYDFILIKFSEQTIGFRTYLKNYRQKKREIKTYQLSDRIIVIYLTSFRWWFLGDKFLNNERKKTIRFLFNYLETKNMKVDLVHAQSLFSAGIWAYFIKGCKGIPYVLTEHNQISFLGRTSKDWILSNKILKNSSRNLVVSIDKIRQFASNYIFADFHPLGNAIYDDIFCYEQTVNISDDFTITTIGAYTPIKDQKTMVNALYLVSKELADRKIIFNWIGYDSWGGDKEGDVLKMISKLESANVKIKLFRLLDRNEVAAILKKTDLFLFSSISEGMPVSVLEALACGTPVCSTNCGGVDEIIDDHNGHLVQIKDCIGMSKFIIKVIKGEVVFNRMLISKNIISRYGSKAFREKIKKVYEDAMAQ